MVSSVTNIPAYLSKPYTTEKQALEDERQEKLTNSANAAAESIITNPALAEVLNGPLAQYNDVNVIQVRRIVWSTLNYKDTGKITREDVEFAVTSLGGNANDARNLWDKLDPNDLGELQFEDFLESEFMNNYLRDNLDKVQQAIDDLRIQNIINGSESLNFKSVLDGAGPQNATGTIFDSEF
jgi:hypothetical protein